MSMLSSAGARPAFAALPRRAPASTSATTTVTLTAARAKPALTRPALALPAIAAAAALVAGCLGGGGDGGSTMPGGEASASVPDSALGSSTAYTQFTLTTTESTSETAEPLTASNVTVPPSSETDEPAPVS